MAREARANIRMAQSTWNAYEDVAQALGLRTTALMRQVIEGAVPAMQQMGAALGRADQESVKVVTDIAPEG